MGQKSTWNFCEASQGQGTYIRTQILHLFILFCILGWMDECILQLDSFQNSSRFFTLQNSKTKLKQRPDCTGTENEVGDICPFFGRENPTLGSKVIRRGQLKLKLLLAANSYGFSG